MCKRGGVQLRSFVAGEKYLSNLVPVPHKRRACPGRRYVCQQTHLLSILVKAVTRARDKNLAGGRRRRTVANCLLYLQIGQPISELRQLPRGSPDMSLYLSLARTGTRPFCLSLCPRCANVEGMHRTFENLSGQSHFLSCVR